MTHLFLSQELRTFFSTELVKKDRPLKFKNVIDVAQWRLCVGCGVCASICPEQKIGLIDLENDGIRPVMHEGLGARTRAQITEGRGEQKPEIRNQRLDPQIAMTNGKPMSNGKGHNRRAQNSPMSYKLQQEQEVRRLGSMNSGGCEDCRLCLEVCPGISMISKDKGSSCEGNPLLKKRWGVVLEVWEGHASDPEIRFRGSSGGLCTALSLLCLERGYASGVLQVGKDMERPWKNKTYRSTTKEELLSRTGSRYSPASPCDSVKLIEKAAGQSVFVGKPCDVAGLRMIQQVSAKLANKTLLAIGFFCAGTPSTKGTLDLLKKHLVAPDRIGDLRYRGMGWPGMAIANFRDKAKSPLKLTYEEAWGFVQKYRPFRCYLCPDLTAEFADISVGDPWYREVDENDPGRSLILIRTRRGREIFHQAMEEGYVTAESADPEIIYQSQKNLLGKRQAIWGRLLAMKAFGIPTPKLEGFHLFQNWLDLSVNEKVRSILGTARRIVQREYYKPTNCDYPAKSMCIFISFLKFL